MCNLWLVLILGLVLIYSIWFLRFTNKKIGGVTGDTLGAIVETAGVVALLTGVILTK